MYLTGTKTPATGKTVTVNLSKAGAAFGAAAGTVAEIANGWYKVGLTTVDTNTVGDLAFNCTASGCDPTDFADQVGATPANMVQINGQATNGNNATLSLAQLNVQNSGGAAIIAVSTGGNGAGIQISGNGTGNGIISTGGSTGAGIAAVGGSSSGPGINAFANGAGDGITAVGTGNGNGLNALGHGSGNGISAGAGATGHGISAEGGATSGNGITAIGQTIGHGILSEGGATSGDGILAIGVGSGNGIQASGSANGNGFGASGSGSGNGIAAIAGTTGNGIQASGGSGSGQGIDARGIGNGIGLNLVGVGNKSLVASQGISGPLDASTYNAMADAALVRDWTVTTVSSTPASRSTMNALRVLRNGYLTAGSTVDVLEEDGSSIAWTSTVTTSGGASLIVENVGN